MAEGKTALIAITIHRYGIPFESPLEVFVVTVERDNGVWSESYGSEELLRAFLQGVRAGSPQYVSFPEIPTKSEPLPEPLLHYLLRNQHLD